MSKGIGKGAATKAKYGETSHGLLTGFRHLWRIFSQPERRNLVLLLFLILSLALVELVGIGSIMPFLAVASNPGLIETNRYLSFVYTRLGFTDSDAFLVMLGLTVVALVVFSNFYKLLVKYAQSRFARMRGHEMSTRLLAKYLSRPYVFFLNENSSDLSKNVLSEVKQVIDGYLRPLLDFMTNLVVGVSIILLLVAVSPEAASIVALSILAVYGGIYFLVRNRLQKLGRKRLEANRERYKSSIEAMAGIKDVKLLGKERYFVNRYSKPSKKMARYQVSIALIGKVPKYVLTAMVNGGVVLAITLLMVLSDDFAALIPVIGVYVYAGNKLLPAFQNVFQDLAKVRSTQPVVELMFAHLRASGGQELPKKRAAELEPLPFERAIELRELQFRYPGSDEEVIDNITLRIAKNTTVGFVGPTGCGKTTLVDVILGLLRPTAGQVLVDDLPLTDANLRNWQGLLGYVPQSIYLSDDSITRNIAFGIPDEEIKMEAVAHAAEIANLRAFIETELPRGFDTVVGERGMRLSGGQRQRLGIARALYHDPQVLVMDEATSALDGVTETVIMEAIEKLTGSKTIILIAHRLSTLADCDVIYMLERGRITAHGTYTELMQSNTRFKQMARAAP